MMSAVGWEVLVEFNAICIFDRWPRVGRERVISGAGQGRAEQGRVPLRPLTAVYITPAKNEVWGGIVKMAVGSRRAKAPV